VQPATLRFLRWIALFTAAAMLPTGTAAQTKAQAKTTASGKDDEVMRKAPPRAEGEGPFPHLILRGATVIDGTGAPPVGPVDIVIEKNRITKIVNVGFPGVPLADKIPASKSYRPKAGPGDKEIDVTGMYVLPGFINAHVHTGPVASTGAEYIFKLWLGHGITTVREVWGDNGIDWTLDQRDKSARNEITAPRIKAYIAFGMHANDDDITDPATPEAARKWVADLADRGADGIKFVGAPPDVFQAALDEARKRHLGTAAHLSQTFVARANALDTARWGLNSMEHWYGLPEALFDSRTVQDFPLDYNYLNEQNRFGYAGRLWLQAAKPGSEKWNAVRDELVKLNFTIDPTMTIYEANRDLMRARRAEWHDQYTLPALWKHYAPNRTDHGSYWFYWTTEDEVAWKHNYQRWMEFLNDYKNHGGRVTTGEDAGFIYSLYGFGYIRELELLREAGFHPLEVFRAATLNGAELLGISRDLGSVEVGKLADLVVVPVNPLENIAALYGTGAIQLNEKNEVTRVGGVRYTIKDGIVYDAPKLLADVRRMVKEAKEKENFSVQQPGTGK
jgi:cytosine/adenosine deaminase-related metal-dependent hydrolase